MIGGADEGLVCEWSAWFVEGVWYGIAGGKLLIEKHILFPLEHQCEFETDSVAVGTR